MEHNQDPTTWPNPFPNGQCRPPPPIGLNNNTYIPAPCLYKIAINNELELSRTVKKIV